MSKRVPDGRTCKMPVLRLQNNSQDAPAVQEARNRKVIMMWMPEFVHRIADRRLIKKSGILDASRRELGPGTAIVAGTKELGAYVPDKDNSLVPLYMFAVVNAYPNSRMNTVYVG